MSLSMGSSLSAQSQYRIGLLPAVNIGHDVGDGWKLNYKTESRLIGTEGRQIKYDRLDYTLTDLSVTGLRRIGINSSMGAGYLIRLEDDGTHHRFLQQYTCVSKIGSFRLGHRFRSDQTWGDDPWQWRLRYRLSVDFPISGEDLNEREFYAKINHEYLNGWQGGEYDLEIRLVPIIGFYSSDRSKIEAGIDYRIDSFLSGVPGHTLWWSMTWYMKL